MSEAVRKNEVRILGPVGDDGFFIIHDLKNRVWDKLRRCFIGFGLGFRTRSFPEAFREASKAKHWLAHEVSALLDHAGD